MSYPLLSATPKSCHSLGDKHLADVATKCESSFICRREITIIGKTTGVTEIKVIYMDICKEKHKHKTTSLVFSDIKETSIEAIKFAFKFYGPAL